MFKRSRKNEADLLSSFFASTCALSIGLNLSWSSADFTKEQLDTAKTVFYLVAMPWAQWAGSAIYFYGPYGVMTFGALASICSGIITAAFPSNLFGLYAARMLHGSATASLAVAVPNYMADAGKRHYQKAMLCLVEVHIVTGTLISQALSVLVSHIQANVLITGVTFLNILTLILIRVASRHRCPRTSTATFIHPPFGHQNDKKTDQLFPNEPAPSAKRSLLADKERRNSILVCVALFAFRDFSGIHLFTKSIRQTFDELNTGPVSYAQSTLIVTITQLIFTIMPVFAIEMYGKRKLALISSTGMLLSMIALEMVIWNNVNDTGLRYVYLTIVLLLYVLFFAQGVGSIPLVLLFDSDHRKERHFATALVISVHFLFLMITEFTYVDERCVYSEHTAYWFIFVCFAQTVFVYRFIEPEPMDTLFD